MKRASLFFLSLFLAPQAFSAPTITAVTGTIATGQSVQITGTNNGTKTNAQPALWADFEDGTGNPTSLGLSTSWSGADSLTDQTSFVYAGSYAAGSTAGWRNTSVGANLRLLTTMTYGSKYYVHVKRYSTQSPYYDPADASHNSKLMRAWNGAVGVKPDWLVGTQVDGTSIFNAETNTQTTGITRFYGPASWSQPPVNVWRTEEYILKNNSAQAAQDGHGDILINNSSAGSSDTFQMDDALNPGAINILVIEQTLANNGSGQWCNAGNVYFDNVYIETGTWQRVMLGNASTFSACTKLEPQIPSAWSDTSITVRIELGAITSGEAKWLYVVDANNAASAGFSLASVGKTSACPCR